VLQAHHVQVQAVQGRQVLVSRLMPLLLGPDSIPGLFNFFQ